MTLQPEPYLSCQCVVKYKEELQFISHWNKRKSPHLLELQVHLEYAATYFISELFSCEKILKKVQLGKNQRINWHAIHFCFFFFFDISKINPLLPITQREFLAVANIKVFLQYYC